MGLDIESSPAPFGHVIVAGGNAWGETQSKRAESVSISVRCTKLEGGGRKRQRAGGPGRYTGSGGSDTGNRELVLDSMMTIQGRLIPPNRSTEEETVICEMKAS
ncbi:hypothetical protein EYF80_005476 [Liparis tanakae]|uniref:Uncharacterized protein n=1 Tax=Liparis tanakae TaxID=230148 RepID=A0A4Z2J1P8_9TELE|nr:hypothetical protein EYF80_005476 [Liparis tanakae]